MKERSLIIFSLLSQLAVGIFITLLVCLIWFLTFIDLKQAIRWFTPGLIVITGSMMVASLTSFFHLGNPRNAWRTVCHFRSSWLSREIIMVIVFTIISVLITCIIGLEINLPGLLYILGGFGTIIGIGLIYVMSRIYYQRTVPAWNTWHTLVHFFLTSLAAGVVGAGILLALNKNIIYARITILMRGMAVAVLVVLLLQVLTLLLWLNPAKKTSAYRQAVISITRDHKWVLILHLILISLTILASGVVFTLSYQEAWPGRIIILSLDAFLVFAAEFFGRELFYLARVRRGV